MKSDVRTPPRVPREHGAWAMLLIAPSVGFALAGRVTFSALAVLAGLVLLFLARYAALPAAARLVSGTGISRACLARRATWTLAYVTASCLMLAAAVLAAPDGARAVILTGAVVVGTVGALQCVLDLGVGSRTVVAQLAGMLGLSAAAPLIAFAAGAEPSPRALGAAALVFAYYTSSLALVRAYRRRAESSAAAPWLGVQLMLPVGLTLLWHAGWLPAAALLAFVPVVARTLWGLASPPESVRALGLRELAVAASFLAIAITAIRW